MEEKEIQDVITEFGKQMGIPDLELDFNDQLQIEVDSGETLHIERADASLLVYISFEVLPYIVSRTLEKMYVETNYKENNTEPLKIGLYNSNIVVAVHINQSKLTTTHLIQSVDTLWNFKAQIIE